MRIYAYRKLGRETKAEATRYFCNLSGPLLVGRTLQKSSRNFSLTSLRINELKWHPVWICANQRLGTEGIVHAVWNWCSVFGMSVNRGLLGPLLLMFLSIPQVNCSSASLLLSLQPHQVVLPRKTSQPSLGHSVPAEDLHTVASLVELPNLHLTHFFAPFQPMATALATVRQRTPSYYKSIIG